MGLNKTTLKVPGGFVKNALPAKGDFAIGSLILLVTFLIFWFSPVHQVTDSNYSLLLSQSLFEKRSFALDSYAIPHHPPFAQDYAFKNGDIYQLEWVNGHLYYFFPPGSSVLSVPFVAAMKAFGVSAVSPDGSYNQQGEIKLERLLVSLLMALTAAVFYLTSRLALPVLSSVLVAIGGALGTQIWSTASRAMWSDSWGILLFAIIVFILLASEIKARPIHPVLLATLLSWTYFVRPTSNLPILGITVYIAIYHRRKLLAFVLTGAIWLAAFVGYAWYHFGKLLPNYYLARRLSFGLFFEALVGHLVSPSRGLLIYVPVLGFVAWLLIRYRSAIRERRLLWLSLLVFVSHLIVISGFDHWWGGFCYGPRLTTSLVPWFALLAIIALAAMRQTQPHGQLWQSSIGLLLLAASILINARGATARETWKWNVYPENVDDRPDRLWSWRDPQMLAGLIQPPLPAEFPRLPGKLELKSTESAKYLWYGWSGPEKDLRWTDGKEAALIFSVETVSDKALQVKLMPYLVAGTHQQQRLTISLNGTPLETVVLKNSEPTVHFLRVQASALQSRNVLTFELPDAVAPASVESSFDTRPLGIAIWWISLEDR